jgi:hypothetical protein
MGASLDATSCSAAGGATPLIFPTVCSAANAPAPLPVPFTPWPAELRLPLAIFKTATGGLSAQGISRLAHFPGYVQPQPQLPPPAASPAPARPPAAAGALQQQQKDQPFQGQWRAHAAAVIMWQPPACPVFINTNRPAHLASAGHDDTATALARCLPTDACWLAASHGPQCAPAAARATAAEAAGQAGGAAAAWALQCVAALSLAVGVALAAGWRHIHRRHKRQVRWAGSGGVGA